MRMSDQMTDSMAGNSKSLQANLAKCIVTEGKLRLGDQAAKCMQMIH